MRDPSIGKGATWRVVPGADLPIVRNVGLDAVPGISHAFSTRADGQGQRFDLGRPTDAGPEVRSRRERFCAAAGLTGCIPVLLQQVHGDTLVSCADAARATRQADGVWSTRAEAGRWVPAVRSADCVPLLLAASDGSVVAAVHAGWRGTALGIAGQAVRALRGAGVDPHRLVAAIGPAIGPCCYEVGDEVLEAVARRCGVGRRMLAPGGGSNLDLPLANRLQLESEGVPAARIQVAPWCTSCEARLFFSYRRHGSPTGSLMACVGWPVGAA